MAFQHASSLDELLPNGMRAVTLSGTSVLLVREGDQVYALEPRCGHMGGPLHEGTLEGHVVICPWHGSQYDVRTGRALRGPYRIPVVSRLLTGLAKPRTTYPARIVGESVEVDLDAASRTAAL
jgi:nitrite reductase/ring-hydroxylating ferredoxin subunit